MVLINKIENYINNYSKRTIHYTIMMFVCVYSTILMIIPGIPRGHDLTYHLSRILALKEGLLLGEFPVKIYPGYLAGYGYANGLFYPDLFLYIPTVLNLLGINLLVAYKLFIFICTIGTFLTMYWCVKGISKSSYAALVSSTLYTLSSYRILDVYERAALGEVLAFIFIPVIILGIFMIIFDDYKQWYILSYGFTGLFLSHIISSVLMTGLTALIFIITFKNLFQNPKRIISLMVATIVTFLSVSFFLWPMMEQLTNDLFIVNTQTITSRIWETTVPFFKLFLEIPNMVFRLGGPSGIGIVFLGLILLRLGIKATNEKQFKMADISLLTGVLCLVASTKLFPWEMLMNMVPKLGAIQFTWRLFLFATAFLSISGGIVLHRFSTNQRIRIKSFIIIMLLSIFSSSMNMFASYGAYAYYVAKDLYELNLDKYSIGLGEYLPKDTNKDDIYIRSNIITSNNDELNVMFTKKGTNIEVDFSNNKKENTYIELPLINYLGYMANYQHQDKRDVLNVSDGENNIVRIDLKSYEKGKIIVKYEGTILQKVTLIISLVTVLLSTGFLVWKYIFRKSSAISITALKN